MSDVQKQVATLKKPEPPYDAFPIEAKSAASWNAAIDAVLYVLAQTDAQGDVEATSAKNAQVDLEALKRESVGAGALPVTIYSATLAGYDDGWNDCVDHLAPRLAAVPEGFVLVPKESTEEMVDAGAWAVGIHNLHNCQTADKVWNAMIQAAQEGK